jgi:hypothetical protein
MGLHRSSTMSASAQMSSMPCSRQELVQLVYNTVREKYSGLYFPETLALLAAKPREFLLRRVRDIRLHVCA